MKDLYRIFQDSTGVSTDSRTIREGQMFFALSGPNFDGSQFIGAALDKGAHFAITDNPSLAGNKNILVVDDVLITLQKLARYHRDQLGCKVLALTGTNGKTTTKELLACALGTKFKISKTKGNLNNHIGVPLSLLSIDQEIDIAIIEMGANKKGDIHELSEIAHPDYGLITNIGVAHIEGFGSENGVFETKTELYRYLKAHGKFAFVDFSDPLLLGYLEELELAYFPYNVEQNKLTSADNGYKIDLSRNSEDFSFEPLLFGTHNLQNYIAAIDIAHYFGVSYADSIPAVSAYQSSDMRSQTMTMGTNRIILDAYNANLTSMKLSISQLFPKAQETVLLLGDMKEMGENSVAYHQEIVDFLGRTAWAKVILVGPEFLKTDIPEAYLRAKEALEVQQQIDLSAIQNKKILIKGSRSMKMEDLLDHFKQR